MSDQHLVAVNNFKLANAGGTTFQARRRHVGNDAYALVNVSPKTRRQHQNNPANAAWDYILPRWPSPRGRLTYSSSPEPLHAGECRWDYNTPEKPVRSRPIQRGASRLDRRLSGQDTGPIVSPKPRRRHRIRSRGECRAGLHVNPRVAGSTPAGLAPVAQWESIGKCLANTSSPRLRHATRRTGGHHDRSQFRI